MIPLKPKIDNSCNACGVCCIAEQCRISIELFGEAQLCPALEWEDSRFWRGLMRHPASYDAEDENLKRLGVEEYSARYYQLLIGAGKGCDSED